MSTAAMTLALEALETADQRDGYYSYSIEIAALREALSQQGEPAQQPLSEGVMWSIWNAQGDDYMEQEAAIRFAREVERAHGIGGGE